MRAWIGKRIGQVGPGPEHSFEAQPDLKNERKG